MRVISQSRNFSFDFDRAVFWTQYNVIYAKIGKESIAIGQYKSDERASEVFEDMHKAYSPYGLICDNITEEQIQAFIGSENVRCNVINMENIDCAVTTSDSVVYYIPKE